MKDSFCLNFKTPPLPGVKGEYKEQGRVVQLDELPVYIVGDTTTPPPTKVMLCLHIYITSTQCCWGAESDQVYQDGLLLPVPVRYGVVGIVSLNVAPFTFTTETMDLKSQ